MRRWACSLLVTVLASGCCGQSGPCPQNDVMIVIRTEQESVPVTVVGYEFECIPSEQLTLCRTAAIADGDYQLVVQPQGHPAEEIELRVRTNVAPSFSCECEIPTGRADLELGAPRDAGVLAPDAEASVSDASVHALDDAGVP